MKKVLVVISILISNIILAQNVKFLVISNPEIDNPKSTAVIDSTASLIKLRGDINFIIITGSLTKNGTVDQFAVLKKSLDNISVPYFLLPGNIDLHNADGWFFFKGMSDSKFIHNANGFLFVGLSPAIPFTQICHFTPEDLDWLRSVLDSINMNQEFYFISPLPLENMIDNWKQLFLLFNNKPPQLIINGNSDKPILKNFLGHNLFNTNKATIGKNGIPNYFVFDIAKDSILILDGSNKLIASIDKTINIEKNVIDTVGVETFNSDILMRTDLNYTMLTSTNVWEKRIYTSDVTGLISCIDSSGKPLWDFDMGGDIFSKPVIADRILTAATLQGDLVTLSAVSGEQIQSIGFEEPITSDLSIFEYQGNKELMVSKLTNYNSALVFGTSSGKLFCYDLETLQEYWANNDAKGMISSKPICVNNKILFSSRDGYLYCIDARTGLLIWRWKEKADTDLSGSPIFCDGQKVFAVSSDGILYAINLLLGKLEWKFDKPNLSTNFSLSSDNKRLFIESNEKFLYVVQADKGRMLREVKLEDKFYPSMGSPVDIGNDVFFSNNGTVWLLDGKYNAGKVLFLGEAPNHPLIKFNDNKYLVSNIDGRIIIFSLR